MYIWHGNEIHLPVGGPSINAESACHQGNRNTYQLETKLFKVVNVLKKVVNVLFLKNRLIFYAWDVIYA